MEMATVGTLMNYGERGRRQPLSTSRVALADSRLTRALRDAEDSDEPGAEQLWELAYRKRSELRREVGAILIPVPAGAEQRWHGELTTECSMCGWPMELHRDGFKCSENPDLR